MGRGRVGSWEYLLGGREGEGSIRGRGGKVTDHLYTTREGLTDEGAWWGKFIGRE